MDVDDSEDEEEGQTSLPDTEMGDVDSRC